MSMRKELVELKEKHAELQRRSRIEADTQRYELKCLECELAAALKGNADEVSLLKRQNALTVEEKVNALRKEMQEALITSDLKRVEAVARFDTYKEMDTKADRQHISKMLDKAIVSLGQRVAGSDNGGDDE